MTAMDALRMIFLDHWPFWVVVVFGLAHAGESLE